jgi:uncharacterized protein
LCPSAVRVIPRRPGPLFERRPVGQSGDVAAPNSDALRFPIRVKPGASRTRVGGSRDGVLVVAVQARAVDGKATEAALKAVAHALGLRRRDIELVTGATSRDKVVEAHGDPEALGTAVQQLLGE